MKTQAFTITRRAGMAALAVAATLPLTGCLTGAVGPNTLIVPAMQTGMQLASHATGAAMDKVLPKQEHELPDPTQLQAQAESHCVEKSLSEEQCEALKRNYARAADFVMTVQGLEEVAEAERDRQRAEAFKPQNIARKVVGGAVDQTVMLGNASVAGELSRASRP